ncbi:MAG TPA: hypothetical protein VLB27_02380, partial [candidate division Zixibacteria bacterium]|nr:hypothetical protein [candidate division Zixibacteria bacterium]
MSLHQTQIAATDIFVPQAKTQRAADRPSDRLFAHELSQQSANQTKTQEPRISKRSDSNGVTTDRGAVNAGSARRSIEEDKIGARVIDSEFENGAQKILNSEQVNIATGVPTELWLDSP